MGPLNGGKLHAGSLVLRPPKLSVYVQISESLGAEMTFDNGDVTGKMGMSGVVGVSGNL